MDLHVTVFSKPGCQQCVATMKTLDRRGIPYVKCDVTLDTAARDQAMSHGFTALPIVQVDQDGQTKAVWSGYRDDHLRQLADASTDLTSLDTRVPDSQEDGDQDTGPVPGGSVTGV